LIWLCSSAASGRRSGPACQPRSGDPRIGLDLREHVDTLGSGLIARLVGEPACEPAHDPIEDGHHVGAGGHRVERECQPVLVGDKHPIRHEQVEVHASHPARRTARTQAAALAAEDHDDLVMARRAAHAREAMGQHAAPQILGELALDVPGRVRAAVSGPSVSFRDHGGGPIAVVQALSEYCCPAIGTVHGVGYSQQVPSAVFAYVMTVAQTSADAFAGGQAAAEPVPGPGPGDGGGDFEPQAATKRKPKTRSGARMAGTLPSRSLASNSSPANSSCRRCRSAVVGSRAMTQRQEIGARALAILAMLRASQS
jgi:hypothetical protein